MAGALEGIVVLDLSGHVAGPLAGSLLGDLGCEVIKVELPGGGDTHRGRNPNDLSYGASFRALNRNKKSLTLNLQSKEGKHILLRLVEHADVLLENFRPATRDRLGLSYDTLSQINPRLIHCSISGYGESGPYRDKPGFDTLGQALSGMIHLVSGMDNPMPIGIAVIDHAAGMFAAYGIMAALLARHQTGRGQFVDTSLLRVGLAFNESHIMDKLNNDTPVLQDSYVRGRIYSFIDSDGLPLIIHLGGHEESWEGLVKAAGREDLLKDSRFADRKARSEKHEEIVHILQEEFRKKPRSYWREALDSYGVPNAPVYRLDEVFQDPQIKHMGLPLEVSHPQMGTTRLVGSAIGLSETPPQIRIPAPLLGEHTAEILRRLDYSDESIQELQGEGVV